MATSAYITGRKRYQRPQAIIWSNNSGTLSNGFYVPTGYEIGATVPGGTDPNLVDQFLILSDHNRGELNFSNERIEQRQRTINGRMRSYYIADKLNMSVSWTNLPSRANAGPAEFDSSGISAFLRSTGEYTADGGAGGVELLDWYENHKGSFWMFLSYDKYSNFGKDEADYGNLNKYNQIVEVFISDFNYSVQKRGGNNLDLWNVSVTLEEV
jgi:hypothetical protein